RPQISAVGLHFPAAIKPTHAVVETVEMHGVDLVAGINPAPAYRLADRVLQAFGVGPGFAVDCGHEFSSQCARTVCPDADEENFILRTAARGIHGQSAV